MRFPAFALTPVFLGAFLASCQRTSLVCKLSGPINDPSNRAERRDILAKGLDEFCAQMRTRNAPLKMAEDQPVIGRFYPRTCAQQILDNGDFWVRFEGEGYAWTNLSKKVTFSASGQVRYNQDFRCSEENAIYAYFPVRQGGVQSEFAVRQIEGEMANLVQGWANPYAESFGRQMVGGKLAEGFTVIYDGDNADVGMGILPLGQRPLHPYSVHGSSKIVYESLRTEIHENQRDFIGPIEIKDSGRSLFVDMTLDGLPAADLLIMRRAEGEASLRLYLDYRASGPLAGAPQFADVLSAGTPYRRNVPLPPGLYYVVIDNTPTAGTALPPQAPMHDAAATVSYLIQIGDTP